MNDRQLKTFICVAEQKSFSKAAAMSFISTPALISQINTLEKDLEVSLFNRSTHGIELTEEGVLFLDTAQKLLDIYEDARDQSARLSQKYIMHIVLQSLNVDRERGYILKYQMAHPDMMLCIDYMDCQQAREALLNDEIQIIYGPEPTASASKKLHFTAVSENVFSITARADHPLAARECVTMKDLKSFEVNVYNCPLWRVNPGEMLKHNGVKVRRQDMVLGFTEFFNKMLSNEVLLAVGDIPVDRSGCIRTIPTDISAGRFGFLTGGKPSPEVQQFIESFMEEYRQNQ